ncbi:MAG: flagellar basal body-associated FliL family protein [Reyranella sp.]
MIDKPEPSSPACLAHEADDAYMGFAGRAEIAAFLAGLETADAESIRKMLPRIRDDVLHKELSNKLKDLEG